MYKNNNQETFPNQEFKFSKNLLIAFEKIIFDTKIINAGKHFKPLLHRS